MLKPNGTCLVRCNFNNFRKNVATNQKYILRKMDWRFQTSSRNSTLNISINISNHHYHHHLIKLFSGSSVKSIFLSQNATGI